MPARPFRLDQSPLPCPIPNLDKSRIPRANLSTLWTHSGVPSASRIWPWRRRKPTSIGIPVSSASATKNSVNRPTLQGHPPSPHTSPCWRGDVHCRIGRAIGQASILLGAPCECLSVCLQCKDMLGSPRNISCDIKSRAGRRAHIGSHPRLGFQSQTTSKSQRCA